jgi:hypothetical protein
MANTLAGHDALGRLGRAEKQRRGVECVRASNSDWVSTSNSNACRFRSTVCETDVVLYGVGRLFVARWLVCCRACEYIYISAAVRILSEWFVKHPVADRQA